jgi:tRNA (guanine-N7-)-methyltransferase
MTEISNAAEPRRIKSFVRRAGRITRGQEQALEELWPTYGVALSAAPLQLDEVFDRPASCVMEIGFGNGEALVAAATAQPETNFLGVEVHRPGVGHCLMSLRDADAKNVRLICEDAVPVLRNYISDGALAGVHLFFPDPWPKKRHHKRRLVQSEFAALIAQKIKPDGVFHVATDWSEYAEHIDTVMSSSEFFVPLRDAANRPKTRFEKRGERLGHPIWERIFQRI